MTAAAVNKSRKTKSERDKRRSSRVSLLEQKDADLASSENSSSESSTEEKQKHHHQQQQQPVRYRKRAGSKRADVVNNSGTTAQTPDNNNMMMNKENIESRRKRAGSKNVHRLSITIVPGNNKDNSNNNNDGSEQEQSVIPLTTKTAQSTATLQMNGKDIYSGTWNPKERAVLDQVLNNMGEADDGTKSDHKKSFIRMFKRSNGKTSSSVPPSPSPAMPSLASHCHHQKSIKEEQIDKILEDLEGELGVASSTPSIVNDYIFDNRKEEANYPLSQYYNSDVEEKKLHKKPHNNNSTNKFGIFRRIKESVKQRHEEALIDRQLQHYLPSPNIKKRGIFGRFHSKNKTKNKNGVAVQGRSRALSSNDYARSVGVYVQPESAENGENCTAEQNKKTPPSGKSSNLSKSKSGSFRNIFSSSNRAKSMDNLNGAFEYYANPKQVFQRTPSMSKLNSRAVSMEKLDHHNKHHYQMKRSTSQKSLGDHYNNNNNNKHDLHAFEPVQLTAKELCYEENPMSYAQARFVQQQHQQKNTPSAHYHDNTNLHKQRYSTPPSPHLQRHQIQHHQQQQQQFQHQQQQPQSDGYCSAYENDLYRGYQSDVTPAMYHRRQQHHTQQQNHYQNNQPPQRFTFDQPPTPQQLLPSYCHQQHQQGGYSSSDVECNSRSATGSLSYQQEHQQQQVRHYTPQPPLPQQHPSSGNPYAGASGSSFQDTTPPPMSPYFLPPQHALPLPGYYTPGYATPGAIFPRSGYETPNGYTSENDYGYYAQVQYSPHFQRPSQQQSGYVAYQSRQAVQRSLSKNSSNSNYSGNFGYASESSFCDDEVYSMVQPPPQGFSPRQFLPPASSAEYYNCSGIKRPTPAANHYQLTTDV